VTDQRAEPPDWALPAWDALDGGSASEAGPGGERPPRLLPGERLTPRGPSEAWAGAPFVAGATPVAGSGDPGATRVPGGLRILAVSEVTTAVREAIRTDGRLRDVWVEGEVGRVTVSSAGHAYFTLKDERSQLQCVWFRDDRRTSPFEPATGLRVVAHGRVDVFDQQGVYQLYVSSLQPAGFGDLAIRFEALKAKLAAEGLFDSGRKRPLPVRPAVIAVATSESGAVWHDIRQVLERRWPLARVVFSPCQVQGEAAPSTIVAALERIARYTEQCRVEGRLDAAPAVTILARGGGSLEDLWAFNDERVVRAIAAHPVPLVCGVGHETDVTLADFAADVRAPTPSVAAEIVVPERVAVGAVLRAELRRANVAVDRLVGSAAREVAAERRALERLAPAARLAADRERAGLLLDRATRSIDARLASDRAALLRAATAFWPSIERRVASAGAGLASAVTALTVLGPQATLQRGYAIARLAADGSILRDPAGAPTGTGLRVTLAGGELGASSLGPIESGSGAPSARAPARPSSPSSTPDSR
jgi:exodeoxyribonuclease VII large subunit